MSTKIYVAYRIPERRLNDFIDLIRPKIFDRAEQIVRNLMKGVEKGKIEKWLKKGYKENYARLKFVMELVTLVSKDTKRAPGIDISFQLNIWRKGQYAYIIPIGESYYKSDLNNLPSWIQNYSYWDNADKPENLKQSQWTQRMNAWNSINLGSGYAHHNARRLCHSVIDFSQIFGDFDAEAELERRILGKKEVVK